MTVGQGRRPLRIAYLIASLRVGGAEMRVLSLVERLPRDRFEVDFLSLIGEGPLDQRGRDAGARIRFIGQRPLVGSSLAHRASGRAVKFARYLQFARSARYDIVDAWLYPTDVVAAVGRFLTRTPVVLSGRADLLPRDSFGPLSRQVERLNNRLVDAVVANSDAVATRNRDRYGVDPSILHVIRNGVELAEPVSAPERQRLRLELGAADHHVLIGAVGTLREVKRHELLIDAFAELCQSRQDVRLAIIGEGPMRGALERQIDQLGLGSRIRMPGAIVPVQPMLDALDIVALSSRSEGLPNALLEGAAAGKPIVTTAAGGAVEVAIDGVTGIVVPVEDQEALARAMARLADDPDLRRRLGSAAKEHAATSFGMDRMVREWCELYEGLAVAKGVILA